MDDLRQVEILIQIMRHKRHTSFMITKSHRLFERANRMNIQLSSNLGHPGDVRQKAVAPENLDHLPETRYRRRRQRQCGGSKLSGQNVLFKTRVPRVPSPGICLSPQLRSFKLADWLLQYSKRF